MTGRQVRPSSGEALRDYTTSSSAFKLQKVVGNRKGQTPAARFAD
jgi:hypothetical protein